MCGISGIVSVGGNISESSLQRVDRMVESLKHRGPDGHGIIQSDDNRVIFGHNRLSIVDLSSAGSQPMKSSCGKFLLTFNGEIYNHLEIRKMLDRKGEDKINWRGTSDSETLVNCVALLGIDETLQILNGMFAFVVYDLINKVIYMARDRYGEKPLHFAYSDSELSFSSEVKSLKEAQIDSPNINRDGVNQFFKFGFITEDCSIYNEISQVMPGRFISLDLESWHLNSKQFWQPKKLLNKTNKNFKNKLLEDQVINKTRDLLEKAVKRQMLSDVPLGAFLSGGIDSSLVVSFMQEISDTPISTFSIGSNSNTYDESEYAEKIANQLGTNHHTLIVTPEDLLKTIDESIYSLDQPFADSSYLVTKMLSTFARKHVTVALTGDGADELFGGYNRHVMGVSKWPYVKKVPFGIRRLTSSTLKKVPTNFLTKIINSSGIGKQLSDKVIQSQKAASVFGARNLSDFYLGLLSQNETIKLIKEFSCISDISLDRQYSDLTKLLYWDSSIYLPNDILTKVDRASMSVSLETRSPFLDKDVSEFVLPLPDFYKIRKVRSNNWESKWLLRQILKEFVPEALWTRPKQGFGFPLGDWLKNELRDEVTSTLSEKSLMNNPFIDHQIAQSILSEHFSGYRNWQYQIWSLLVFQKWYFKENDAS